MLTDVSAGSHSVSLNAVAANCSVTGDNPYTMSVTAGSTAQMSFTVSCLPAVGDLEVTATTNGDAIDPDGYTVVVDGTISQAIGVNGTATFSDTALGQHEVRLTGVADNCWVSGWNPRTVTVTFAQVTRTSFVVACRWFHGRIAYVSNRDGGQYDVFVMNADGSNPVNLTNHSAAEGDPAWSPDGTRIAFSSDRDGNSDIFVMQADGSNPINLTNHPAWDAGPAWSPDGTQIAFTSDRDGNDEIYVMQADGSNPINLTNHSAWDAGPAWSPDGTRIAFVTGRHGQANGEIYVMQADGSNPINLTNTPEGEWDFPAWSPDGTQIAFTSWRSGENNVEIYVMQADGSNQTKLTDLIGWPEQPTWSPDGSRIAFALWGAGNPEIYVMGTDGSNPANVTNHPAEDWDPAWSPEE
jgi:Tol biopolymer transport system component